MSAGASQPVLLASHSLIDPPSAAPEGRGELASPKTPSFREVLACVDGSELESGVMRHANLVARAVGARLTLLRVLEADAASGATPQDPLDWGIRRREAQAHLERLAAGLDLESGIHSQLIQGRAAEQICAWAEQHLVDLTVLCSHGIRGLTDWDLASTARKLVDRIPGSLLLIPASVAGPAEQELRYQCILVPLDGSSRAESVLPVAMRIAMAQNAGVLLAHVVPVPEIMRTEPLDAEGAELERRMIDHNQRAATVYLDRLRARISRTGTRVRSLVVGDGNVRARLDRLIRGERPDLVLMSAHGHTGRIDAPCGSIAEHAVTHATTPLLVVRDRLPRRMRRICPSRSRLLEGSSPQDRTSL